MNCSMRTVSALSVLTSCDRNLIDVKTDTNFVMKCALCYVKRTILIIIWKMSWPNMFTPYNRATTMVFEGQEKADFWNVLGGKEEYASEKHLQVYMLVSFCLLFLFLNLFVCCFCF